jgi:biofilm PGA synthesis N-glycosyltransferase PgaC
MLILIVTLAYVGLIVALSFGLNRVLLRSFSEDDSGMPISVIVAFKDEALNLPNLLDSLLHQSLPKEKFELILVNDHSTDASVSIVEQYCSMSSNFRLINLPENRTGKKAAIAFGVKSASHSLIALTDADCIPNSKWLEAIYLVAKSGSTLMIGPVVMNPIQTLSEKFQALDYASLMASAGGSCGIGHPIIASSANLAFRNDLLNVTGNTLNSKISSGDDMFLLHHIKRTKVYKISFLGRRDAIVKTSTAPSLLKAINQRKRWASKSIHYRDVDTIFTGFAILLFNIVLIVLLIGLFFRIESLNYFSTLFLIKIFVDLLLLYRYLNFIEQKELLKVFLPLQLLYPFYLVYSFASGIISKTSWKGRATH